MTQEAREVMNGLAGVLLFIVVFGWAYVMWAVWNGHKEDE